MAYNPKYNYYLVVYARYDSVTSDYDIFARRVNKSGPMEPEIGVALSADNETYPAVAYNTNSGFEDFMVVWQHGVHTPPTAFAMIRARRVPGQPGQNPTGTDFTALEVTSDSCMNPDIAYNHSRNEYLVVGQCGPFGSIPPQTKIYAQMLTGGGTVLGPKKTDLNEGYSPSVAANGDANEFMVAYVSTAVPPGSNPLIAGNRVPGEFGPVFSSFSITDMSNDVATPEIAHIGKSSTYALVWAEQLVAGWDILGRMFSLTENWWTDSFYTYGSGSNETTPDIAGGPVNALAAWEEDDLFSSRVNIFGRLLGYQIFLPLANR